MTPDHLRTLLRTAVTRYARTIADGSMPVGLVEELAGIADQHAADTAGSATLADRPESKRRRTTDQTTDR